MLTSHIGNVVGEKRNDVIWVTIDHCIHAVCLVADDSRWLWKCRFPPLHQMFVHATQSCEGFFHQGGDPFGTWHHFSVALAIDCVPFFDFLVFQFGELTVWLMCFIIHSLGTMVKVFSRKRVDNKIFVDLGPTVGVRVSPLTVGRTTFKDLACRKSVMFLK